MKRHGWLIGAALVAALFVGIWLKNADARAEKRCTELLVQSYGNAAADRRAGAVDPQPRLRPSEARWYSEHC